MNSLGKYHGDRSSHSTNSLKIPFHHLPFLYFLCGSTDTPPLTSVLCSLSSPSTSSTSTSPAPSLLGLLSVYFCLQTLSASSKVDRGVALGISDFSSLSLILLSTVDTRLDHCHSSKASFFSLKVRASMEGRDLLWYFIQRVSYHPQLK